MFLVQLTTSRIGNHTRSMPSLLKVMTTHTHTHTQTHTAYSILLFDQILIDLIEFSQKPDIRSPARGHI